MSPSAQEFDLPFPPLPNLIAVRLENLPDVTGKSAGAYYGMACIISEHHAITANHVIPPNKRGGAGETLSIITQPGDERLVYRIPVKPVARDANLDFAVLSAEQGFVGQGIPAGLPFSFLSERIPEEGESYILPKTTQRGFVVGKVGGIVHVDGLPYIRLVKVGGAEDALGVSGAPVFVGDRVVGIMVRSSPEGDSLALPVAEMAKSHVTPIVRNIVQEHAAAADSAPAGKDASLERSSLSPGARGALDFAEWVRSVVDGSHVHPDFVIIGVFLRAGESLRKVFRDKGFGENELLEFVMDNFPHDVIEKLKGVLEHPLRWRPPAPYDAARFHDTLREALATAQNIARQQRSGRIKTRHLLYGALSVKTSPLVEVLSKHGIGGDDFLAEYEPDLPEPLERTISGIRSDDAQGEDQLGVKRDVWALCSLLAAEDLNPPVSVGLFGDWGSGKSFFMRMMEDRIKWLSKSNNPAYCKNIIQLKFNAWHYIDTENLWASLTSEIFEGLAKSLAVDNYEEPEFARARLMAATANTKEALAQAELHKSQVDDELRVSEERMAELEKKEATLSRGEVVLQAYRAVVSQPEVEEKLEEAAKTLGLPDAKAASAEVKKRLLELHGLSGALRAFARSLGGAQNLALWVLAALIFTVVLAVAYFFVLPWAVGQGLSEAVGRLTMLLGSVAAALSPFAMAAKRAVKIIGDARERVEAERKKIQKKTDAKREDIKKEKVVIEKRVEEAKGRVERARDELAKLEDQLKRLSADKRMLSFIQERYESADYTKHLGVIARAHKDFRQLSGLLAEVRKKAAGGEAEELLRPIDRIILYIDDLDRCPEDKVVTVLQAVHLLLAFPLFVVVVGVDPRWLLHSLKQHLRAFQRDADDVRGMTNDEERTHWQSTPTNYLEKIFQIPFTLRPMGSRGFSKLIQDLARPRKEGGEEPPERTLGEGAGVTHDAERDAPAGVPSGGAAPVVPVAAAGQLAAAQTPRGANGGGSATGQPPQSVVAVGEGTQSATGDGHNGDATGGGGGASGGGASEGEPPQRAERHLLISDPELKFMKLLHGLIPSPRAAKRFVNVYRLLRAGVDDDRLDAFAGTETQGEHRPVLLLLAILTGYPDEASEIFRKLLERDDAAERWWDFVETFRARAKARQTQNGGGDEGRSATEAARWHKLMEALDEIHATVQDDPTCEEFKRCVLGVARFSFQAGRVLLVSQEEAEED